MKSRFYIAAVVMIGLTLARAQVASHAPMIKLPVNHKSAAQQVADRPAVRVNDAVLTDRDVLREMYAIFPYARQHDGFPKSMEADIRRGAMEMIVFEELVYQEALRRGIAISPARLDRAMAQFRSQFETLERYQRYLVEECRGSKQVLRQKIRRSLLIDVVLKAEVADKAVVTPSEVRDFYNRNAQEFETPETFSIQTISIIPPANAPSAAMKDARKRAEDALRQAKAAKDYREFGLLAEKLSDDDWHVNMGDRHAMTAAQLPPPLVEAARRMKPGEVSELFQFGSNYTLFRLNEYAPAGKASFNDAKNKVRADLVKEKQNRLRAQLNQRLRKNAKVQVL